VRLDTAWQDLTEVEKRFVLEGDGDQYEGVRGFFAWLERKKYKVHVGCSSAATGLSDLPDCSGTRLRREARDVRVGDRTIDACAR